ncbi:MAG: ATP-binding protein [bacterium]
MRFFTSLNRKIWIGYLALILITAGVAIWSTVNFMNLSTAIDNIMVENYRSINATEMMLEAIERQDSALLRYFFQSDQQALRIFKENEGEFLKWLARAEDNITIDGEKEIIENLNRKYVEFVQEFSVMQKMDQKNSEAIQKYYLETVFPNFQNVKKTIRKLSQLNHETMLKAQEHADKRAIKATYSTIVISSLLILIGFIFVFYLIKIILKPIKQLTDSVEEIGAGNLKQKIDIQSRDEIGELAHEFNKMTARLRKYEETNINRLKAEKNKSEAIVRSISNPIVVTDSENKIVLINQEAERVFNLKEDNILDRHFLEVINNEEIFEEIERILNNKKTGESKDKIIKLDTDGETKDYRLKVRPVFNRNEEVELAVTLLEDITRLKEIDRMKTEFVSTVSHEFRTPLTSINMSIELLLEENVGSLTEEQRELLEATSEDCDRLVSLIEDLLDLSKIESGQIQLDFKTAKVEEIVSSALQPIQSQADEKNISLETDLETDLPPVTADFTKINWVITNLLGNALRHTESGGKITICARQRGSRAYISVSDTGEGIPLKYRDKIFDKFVSVRGEDESSGTGLGLAISKEIIEAHGGKIWVESKEGEGSTFTFTLKISTNKEKKDK